MIGSMNSSPIKPIFLANDSRFITAVAGRSVASRKLMLFHPFEVIGRRPLRATVFSFGGDFFRPSNLRTPGGVRLIDESITGH